MLDEEVIKRNTQNISERILIANVLIMVLLPALMLGGNSVFASGFIVAMGIVAPINIYIFKKVWGDAPQYVITKYFLGLCPYILTFLITLIGLLNPCIQEVRVNGHDCAELVNVNTPICSAALDWGSGVMPSLEWLAVVGCALSIYYICDSRYILRRILSYCVLGVTALALFGILMELINQMETIKTMLTGSKQTFSTFAEASDWCAFAMIWMGVAFSCALYSSAHHRLSTFFFSFRFVMLLCATILFLTALYTGSPLEKIFACSIYGLGMLLCAICTMPSIGEIRFKLKRKRISSLLSSATIPMWYGLATVFCGLLIMFIFTSSIQNPKEKLLVSANSPISLHEKALLFEDSMKLISERPVFGWGEGSFPTIFAFAQGSDLGQNAWSSPTSDLIKKLVNTGFAGLALIIFAPLIFFLLQLARFDFGLTSIVSLCTLVSVLLMSIFSDPFNSGSVFISFWIFLFSYFTWNKKDID